MDYFWKDIQANDNFCKVCSFIFFGQLDATNKLLNFPQIHTLHFFVPPEGQKWPKYTS